MNHIYSLVWNRALHTLQVAPETARWHGGTAAGSARKRSRRTPIALACAAARVAATPSGRGRWVTASVAAALIAALQGVAPPAVAQASPEAAAAPVTCTWNPGNGNWSSTGNWTGCNSTFPGSSSGAGDNVIVANGIATLDVGGVNAGALTIGDAAGDSSTVDAFGTAASNEKFTTISIGRNSGLYLTNGASMATSGAVSVAGAGILHVGNDNGGGNTTLAVGANLTNAGNIVVGEGGTTSQSLLTVTGAFDNTGGYTEIDSGDANGANSAIVVGGAAPSTLEGTYDINQYIVNPSTNQLYDTTASLQYGSGGITQIGDGGTNGGSLQLYGPGAYVEVGTTNSNSALAGLATIASNGFLGLNDGATATTKVGLTVDSGGTLHVGNDNGGVSPTTMAIGGNLANAGSIVVGEGGTTSPSLLTVTGAFDNTGGYAEIDSGDANGANSAIVVGGAAPSTLEGTYDINQYIVNPSTNQLYDTTASLQYGSGGITQIGDGGTNGGSLQLYGPGAYVEVGATNSNSALTNLTTIASNGFLGLNDGATATTKVGLTVDSGGTLHVGSDNGGVTPTTMSIGGNLINPGTVVVGEGGTTSPTVLTVNGTFDNTGGTAQIWGGTTTGATSTLDVTGAAPSTLEGSYLLVQNIGSAALEYGSGGITRIGDGGSNGGGLTLTGAEAYVEVGNTNSNSALTGLATIASNGFLGLNNGATATTDVALTIDNGGTLHVGNDNGGGNTSMTVGGDMANAGTIVVGEGGTTSPSLLAVNGSFANTGTIYISGGNVTGATSTITSTGPFTNNGTMAIAGFGGPEPAILTAGTSGTSAGADYVQTADNANTTIYNNTGVLNAANVAINGGVLQGDGTVNGNVYNGSVIAGGAGNQPGTLTINGNFENVSTGELAGPYGNTTAGTVVSNLNPGGSEQITVSGAVTLLGGAIQGDAVNGFNYAAGQSETVMNFTPGKLTGVFAGVQNGNSAVSPGTSFDLGNGLTLGVEYNDQQGNIQLVVVNTPTTTTDTWSGGSGNWSTAGSWSADSAPQFFSNVTLGGTGSGDVTLGNGTTMQDATVESVTINSGNTLAYQATTPTSLSVGNTVTVNAGGALSLPTSGDQLELGGNFANSGTTTLGKGAALNTLGTFTNSGTGATTGIGNGASVTAYGGPTSVAAVNGAGATISMAGGSFNAPGLGNAGTVSGNGSINLTDTDIANTGLVEASGGTLAVNGGGIQGAGNITIDTGATLDLSHASAGSTVGTLSDSGSLNLGGNNLPVSSDYDNANFGTGNSFNARDGVMGAGLIDASGNVAQAVTGADVTGGTSTSPVLAFGNVHVGVANSTTYEVENTGTSGPSLRGAIQTDANGGAITDATLTGTGVTAGNWGPIATGGNASFGVTWTPTQAGAQLSGQTVHIANNFANVGAQTLTITGTAYAYADPTVASSLATPYNFGVVQAGQTYTDPLTISNTLTASNAAYQEGLNAAFGAISNSQLTTNGSITNLAAGQSNHGGMVVTLNPTSAGAIGGSVTIDFASNGDGTSGLGITNLNPQSPMYTWQFKGTVVNEANPSITPNPVVLNGRVGESLSQALAVENVATTAPQAYLDAQIGTISGAASSENLSSINQLAAGDTDNTSFMVGLNSAKAGAQSGSVVIDLQSDSTKNGCTSNCVVDLTPETVQVSGNVYTPAVATVNTASPVNFGIVHVGDGSGTLSKSISVTNSAAQTALNDTLLGSVTTTGSSAFTGAGSLTAAGLAAQQSSSALGINLSTATAGIFNGTANLAFASHDSQLANLALTGDSLGLNAQVNNFAKLAFTFGSGVGALSFNGSTNTWTLNLGDLLQGSHGGTASAELAFLNDNPTSESAFTDLLSSNATVRSGSGFDLTGDSVSKLAGGASQGGFGIGLNTSNLGNFSELLAFNVDSIDPDFNQNIGTVDLNLTGDIVTGTITPVPEPGSLPMFLAGLGLLGLLGGSLGFRRKVKQGGVNE